MIAVLFFMLGAADAGMWAEPSLVNVPFSGERSPMAEDVGRVYAAKGEREAFQLCISGGRKGREGLRVEAEAINEAIGAPQLCRVGILKLGEPSARACSKSLDCPDVLYPVEPFDLGPKELAVFWVTYSIPPEAKAGVYNTAIKVSSDRRRKDTFPVRIEVFDFKLPQTPSLFSMAPLDRLSIRSLYGIEDRSLEAWKPFYAFWRGSRLSFEVWDGGGLNPIDKAGLADTSAFKEHLEYAITAADMGCAALGGAGLALFPAAAAGQSLDPLAVYLRDMTAWMSEKHWQNRACVFMPLPERRDAWSGIRDLCGRIGQSDTGAARILAGPPHPYFDRSVDRWAIPFHAFFPDLMFRFSHGLALSDPRMLPLKNVAASSCGALPGFDKSAVTSAEEACDGSVYSGWAPARRPDAKNPEWVELRFASPVTTRTLYLVWAQGSPIQPFEVSFSRDGSIFGPSAMRWKHSPAQPFVFGVSSGTFKYENEIIALRLTFRGSAEKGPLGILEVTLNPPETPMPPQTVPSIEPWLQAVPGEFPSLNADAHPMEARAIGWICWGHDFKGVALPMLDGWPRTWLNAKDRGAAFRMDDGDEAVFLAYPGAAGLMPSVRLERLRDGFEDYEYLWLLSEAQRQGAVNDDGVAAWTQRRLYRPAPSCEELDKMAAQILDARVKIGRALEKAGSN